MSIPEHSADSLHQFLIITIVCLDRNYLSLGLHCQEIKASWLWGEPSLVQHPRGHLELGDLSRLTVELFQNSTNFLWVIVPRARFTLVEDPALLEHVEPLRQRRVLLATLVLHCIHHHRALGAPVQQQAGCLQAVLEVPVIPDVHVVLKSPAI